MEKYPQRRGGKACSESAEFWSSRRRTTPQAPAPAAGRPAGHSGQPGAEVRGGPAPAGICCLALAPASAERRLYLVAEARPGRAASDHRNLPSRNAAKVLPRDSRRLSFIIRRTGNRAVASLPAAHRQTLPPGRAAGTFVSALWEPEGAEGAVRRGAPGAGRAAGRSGEW